MTDYFARLVERAEESLPRRASVDHDRGGDVYDNPFEVIEDWVPDTDHDGVRPADGTERSVASPSPSDRTDYRLQWRGSNTERHQTGGRDEPEAGRRPDPDPASPGTEVETAAANPPDRPAASEDVGIERSEQTIPPRRTEATPPTEHEVPSTPSIDPIPELAELDRLIYGAAGLEPPWMEQPSTPRVDDADGPADPSSAPVPAEAPIVKPDQTPVSPGVQPLLEPPPPPLAPPVEAAEPDVIIDSVNIEIIEPRDTPPAENPQPARPSGILSSSLRPTRSLRGL